MFRIASVVVGLLLVAAPASAARVLLDPAVEKDAGYRFAAGELAAASGSAVAYGAESRQGDVVVGGASPAVKALVASGRPALPRQIKAEGFAISQPPGLTVVGGADGRGDIYGMLWLAERTRLDPKALRTLECLREPALAIREFCDGQGRLEPPGRGFEGWFQECLKLGVNTVQASALPQSDLALAKAYHLNLMGGTAAFADLPVSDLIAKYGGEVSESPGQLCPLKPKVWDLYRERLRAMLRANPELDFVRLSVGDLPADYQVHGCRGPNCQTLSKAEALRLACQAAWEVVVGEFKKTFFISSWGNPPETYPLNTPADYETIMQGLPDHGIVSTINNTQHDFYLISPYNPIIGMTDRPKDIYFEVTTEYAGAGFLPITIGPQIRERLARAYDTGHTVGATGRLWEGVGLWTRDVLWTRANMYAIHRAAWEPHGDPWEWARDWAALTFGPAGSDELADALSLSEELARRTFWVNGFSGEKGPAYAITRRNVITDGTHYSRWAAMPQLEAYRRCQMRGKLQQALESEAGGLALRDRMLERWRAARPQLRDPKLRAACDRDFEHFAAVAEVLIPYQMALLLWCHTQDEGISTDDRCRSARECVNHAREARAAWTRYLKRFDLYRDAGMTEMLGVYLRDCAALSARPGVIGAEPGRPARVALSVFNNAWPAGLRAAVKLELPKGWTAMGDRKVDLAYGKRKEVALAITPPRDAPQGGTAVTAVLASSPVETTTVRVKVIGARGAIAKTGTPACPTTICPRGTKPELDGVISPGEWPAAAPGWVNYPFVRDLSTKDNLFAVEARWMWDDRFFYVAVVIADDVLQPVAGGNILRADTAALVFDVDGDRRDDYEMVLVSFPDAFIAWPKTIAGVQTSTHAPSRPLIEPLGRGVALAMGERPGGPGRVIEAAIPWSLLGGFKPGVGEVMGFAVRFSDADTPGQLRGLFSWPERPAVPDGPYLHWGRADKPTYFADLVFTR